ncbi:MAG: hypothetical protein PWQ39_957 [Thermacetogenium sp.]|nr:hypothetical protein [Thermacetogenium sp.]
MIRTGGVPFGHHKEQGWCGRSSIGLTIHERVMAVEDRELAKIMEEVSEEMEIMKQRILWKIACHRKRSEAESAENDKRPPEKREWSFFSLD